MSNEEVQETEGTEEIHEQKPAEVDTNTSINASLDEIEDAETLRKMVKKLRGENASHRTKKNETEAELAEFRKWKESQMSEIEKANARAQAAEERYMSAVREKVLSKYNVPEDLHEFVTGSEEEMEAKAAKLGTTKDDSTDGKLATSLFRAPGGEAIKVKKENTGAAFLEELFNSK